MALINFGYRVDMSLISSPANSGAFVVGYDLDGVLKQKDYLGNVTPIGRGEQGTRILTELTIHSLSRR